MRLLLIISAFFFFLPSYALESHSTMDSESPKPVTDSVISNMTILSGEKKTVDARNNLIISGEDQPVTIKEGGSITITAGEKIILLPGTKVSAGGTLHASISAAEVAELQKKEKERPLEVTREEQAKVEEHNRLEEAYNLFRPFATPVFASYHNEKKERESITLASTYLTGITCESQQRVVVPLKENISYYSDYLTSKSSVCQIASVFRPVAIMALRL
ncbi:MAG: hypothetical protein HQ542_02930 [Bacteroidia bacterium]|nr:hypothetical protein [Bacteroidia bacterium]